MIYIPLYYDYNTVLVLGVERVSYPVLNLGFVTSGLTPGQVGFDLFEVPITMSIFSHYVFANTCEHNMRHLVEAMTQILWVRG